MTVISLRDINLEKDETFAKNEILEKFICELLGRCLFFKTFSNVLRIFIMQHIHSLTMHQRTIDLIRA